MILIIILNLLFASTFIIAKAVIQYTSPLFFIAFRMIIAGILLLSYNFFFGKKIKFIKTDYLLFGKLTLFHIFIPYNLEFWSLQYISASKTSMIFNLSPFITALFAYFIFSEKLNLKKIIGLIIGFTGFLPLLLTSDCQENFVKQFLFLSLPDIFMILCVASSAYAWILIKQNSNNGIPLTMLNGISMFCAGILSLVASLMFESWNPIPVIDFNNFLLLTFSLIIIGNFICYNLYAHLLRHYTATFLSFAGFSIPLITALLQCIFFNAGITLNFFITAILVSLGLFIFYQEELRHGIIKN